MNKKITLAGYSIELVLRELSDDMDEALWSSLNAEDRAKFEVISHPARRLEWSEGRRALRELSPLTTHRSLAHTRENRTGLAVAAGIQNTDLRGVGVDVENRERAISDSVAAWLVHPAEKNLELSRLAIWMIKEACFKADPEQGTDFTLQAYEITSAFGVESRTEGEARALVGRTRKFLFSLVREESWLIAAALALPTK